MGINLVTVFQAKVAWGFARAYFATLSKCAIKREKSKVGICFTLRITHQMQALMNDV